MRQAAAAAVAAAAAAMLAGGAEGAAEGVAGAAPQFAFSRRVEGMPGAGQWAPLSSVTLQVPGGEMVLDLELNQGLMAAGYKEMVLGPDGVLVERESNVERDCHFVGSVRGDPAASAGVSTCGGVMRACVWSKGRRIEMEHVIGSNETTTRQGRTGRALSEAKLHIDETLPLPEPTVITVPKQPGTQQVAARQNAIPQALTIELLILSDPERVATFPSLDLLANGNLAVSNQVSAFYQRLEASGVTVSVSVVGQIYWEDGPTAQTRSRLAPTLLDGLNAWRRGSLEQLPSHDLLHLFSGKDFEGDTIGLARLLSACDDESGCELAGGQDNVCVQEERTGRVVGCCQHTAAAISETPNTSIVLAAETVAHEIGHQLGFEHDGDKSTGAAGCSKTDFVMAAMADQEPDSDLGWSTCSQNTLAAVHRQSRTEYGYHPYQCLANAAGSPNAPIYDPSAGHRAAPASAAALASAGLLAAMLT